MDVQAAPPTYAATGTGRPPMGNPPVLGQQVPGMTGGLPAQSGLSVMKNPMAQELQSMGRGEDSMLVHMTPNEVNSLQGLAMAHGGSLTINPHTGLPEAGWLGKLLPSLIGFGLNFIPGVGPLLAAGLTAAGTTAVTGDLRKGLMAGLGAYGGAGLSSAIAPAATGAATAAAAGTGAVNAAGQAASEAAKNTLAGTVVTGSSPVAATLNASAANLGSTAASNIARMNAGLVLNPAMSTAAPALTSQAANVAIPNVVKPGLLNAYKAATNIGGTGNLGAMAGGLGLLNSVSGSTGGVRDQQTGAIDNSYQGPYRAQERVASFAPSTEDLLSSSKERTYFNVSQPEIYNMQGQVVQPGSDTAPGTQIWQPVLNPKAKKGQDMYSFQPRTWMGQQLAKGGEVDMRDGSFVVDARTVSELGNGSSNAGIELLSKLGGRPVRGPGDGVSDSVPARIDGKQEARVARDEVIFQPEAVRRLGGGDEARGTKKLYALMDKAHKARKKSARGKNTHLAKGLKALA